MGKGQNVRTVETGDQVLFNPDDRYEVEVGGEDYLILRERDIHAVAASHRLDEGRRGCTVHAHRGDVPPESSMRCCSTPTASCRPSCRKRAPARS